MARALAGGAGLIGKYNRMQIRHASPITLVITDHRRDEKVATHYIQKCNNKGHEEDGVFT